MKDRPLTLTTDYDPARDQFHGKPVRWVPNALALTLFTDWFLTVTGMTQKDLALELGRTPETVSRWVCRRSPISKTSWAALRTLAFEWLAVLVSTDPQGNVLVANVPHDSPGRPPAGERYAARQGRRGRAAGL